MSKWEEKLRKRDDQGKFWWELRSCAYYREFERPKIVYPNIAKTNTFTFDSTGILTNQKAFIIPTDDFYLLGILNSKLVAYWFHATLPLLRGAFFEPSKVFMKELPVLPASSTQKSPILELVEKILTDPDSPAVPLLEKEIDVLVYDLYGLTQEEIAIVEGKDG